MSNRRRRYERLCGAAFTAFIGLYSFFGVAGSPRFESMHTLDVLRLMLVGAAVAVSITLLIKFISGEPPSSREQNGRKT